MSNISSKERASLYQRLDELNEFYKCSGVRFCVWDGGEVGIKLDEFRFLDPEDAMWYATTLEQAAHHLAKLNDEFGEVAA